MPDEALRKRSPMLDDLASRTAALESEGLFKDERVIASPQSAHIELADGTTGAQLLRQQLPRPRQPPGAGRGRRARPSTATATAWRRCASSAAPRPCTSELEARHRRLPRHRGHDPLLVVLRRQRRPVRDAARRARTRSSATRSTTPRSSTASACARPSASATPTTTWPTSKRSCRSRPGRPLPADRHRRRVLDGRRSSPTWPAICDLADQYDALVMVDDSPRRRLHRRRPAAARPSTAASMDRVDIITGTLGKALGGASGGYTAAAARSSSCCASARGPTCSPTRLAPAIAATSLRGARPAAVGTTSSAPARAQHRSASATA